MPFIPITRRWKTQQTTKKHDPVVRVSSDPYLKIYKTANCVCLEERSTNGFVVSALASAAGPPERLPGPRTGTASHRPCHCPCHRTPTPTTRHTERTRDNCGRGPGLRAPLKLEEVNEVLRGHGRKAAVGVSRGAGVSRVLRRGRGGGSGHIVTLSQN